MSSVAFTIARKELRTYFLSPVAVVFLGIFLIVTLFAFFTSSRFFARNIADLRPLFEWMPVLMIFLVGAVTMRAWSEEEKLGTLEVLMTSPIATRDLVMGKFLAGMVLIVIALALTVPLALMVAMLGDLDWGPVFGGYVGAILLAACYLAIGLCVSARTDNQLVALMVTVVVCGLLFLVGSDTVAALAGDRLGEWLRMIGSGSRFASIERGVIDVRDLVYYAAIAGVGLFANAAFLDAKRQETGSSEGRSRARGRALTVALVAANAIALGVWLAPIGAARLDLTEAGDYSLTGATERILERLDEPLRVSGYFSERTHPLLAPLVPQIRDLMSEYEIRGSGNVDVEFQNPSLDPELEERLRQAYDIETVPFRFFGRHEESVVNSYFHILLRYGDQYDVLNFEDLIEVDADETNIDVRLRNLEYDLTSAIKKMSGGFQSLDAMFAGLDKDVVLTTYITPETLPEEYAEVPANVEAVCTDLSERSGGRFSCKTVDPSGDASLQQVIYDRYGFQPMSQSMFGGETFYFYLLFRAGDKLEAVYPQGELTEAGLRKTIEASIKRATPGFLKTVAIFTEVPQAPPADPRMPAQFQQQAPPPEYRVLEQTLSSDYTVRRTNLESGAVEGDVDVLVVGRTGAMTDDQKFAIDQYLMRGGAVIAMASSYDVSPAGQSIGVKDADDGLLQMLDHYGAVIGDGFVLDETNARFPVPIQERVGGITLQRLHFMEYPFFPDVRRDRFATDHIALSGIQNVVVNWGSAIDLTEAADDLEAEVLLETTDGAWVSDSRKILPRTVDGAATAFPPSGTREARALAAALTGRFDSYFARGEADAAEEDDPEANSPERRTIESAHPDARLVVIGSSALASDFVMSLGDQFGAGGGVYQGNILFMRNLIDWAVQDTDLLEIRGPGAFARTLAPLSDQQKRSWEFVHYSLVVVALSGMVLVARSVRRRTKPLATQGAES